MGYLAGPEHGHLVAVSHQPGAVVSRGACNHSADGLVGEVQRARPSHAHTADARVQHVVVRRGGLYNLLAVPHLADPEAAMFEPLHFTCQGSSIPNESATGSMVKFQKQSVTSASFPVPPCEAALADRRGHGGVDDEVVEATGAGEMCRRWWAMSSVRLPGVGHIRISCGFFFSTKKIPTRARIPRRNPSHSFSSKSRRSSCRDRSRGSQ